MNYPFKTIPKKHQYEDFERSKDSEFFGLLWEMGLGKSKEAIDTMCYLYTTGKINACLILANNGSYRNWSDGEDAELKKHCWDDVMKEAYIGVWKEDSGDIISEIVVQGTLLIFVMNVEALAYEKGRTAAMAFVKKRKVLLICDESTTLKNKDAARTKAAVKIAGMCSYRRIMTGTPITNSPLDIYSQCQMLHPKALGFSSYYAFRAYYAKMVTVPMGQRSFMKVSGYQNLDVLTKSLKKFCSIRKKEECLDLPPKIYQKYSVELTDEQEKIYEQMRDDAIVELSNSIVTAPLMITRMMRLHQLVCGNLVDDDGLNHPVKSNRIKALLEVLEEAPGKVIIWATYRANIKEIADAIAREYGGDTVVTYYGDTSSDDRVVAVEGFQNGKIRFFVSNKSGAYGLTLTAASLVVYYSNNYELEVRLQSEDRAHRIGQDKSVTYVDLVSKGTVDEKIIKALRSNKEIADVVLGVDWKQWI
jgi:SNF2 family DNA or RNA helicase